MNGSIATWSFRRAVGAFAAALLLTLAAVSLPVASVAYADESSTLEIGTTQEFLDFVEVNKDADGLISGISTIRLTDDIDLSGISDDDKGNFGKSYVLTYLKRSFDGDGHTIKGLDRALINEASTSKSTGITIKDLTIKGEVAESSSVRGSLANNASNTRFENVSSYVSLRVTGLSSENGVGGIVGKASNSTFDGCSYYGELAFSEGKAVAPVAGICAYASGEISFSKCINYGEVTSTSYSCAGINAKQEGNGSYGFESCANKGTVSNAGYTGATTSVAAGVVASPTDLKGKTYSISNCYNVGDITVGGGGSHNGETPCVGGVIALCSQQKAEEDAEISLSMANCYGTGEVAKVGSAQSKADLMSGEVYPNVIFYSKGGSYNPYGEISFEQLVQQDWCSGSISKCYDGVSLKALDDQVATLGSAYQADVNGVNPDSTPLLAFEAIEVDSATYTLAFDISGLPSGSAATVELFSDKAKTARVEAQPDGTFKVPYGKYYYTVSADGYSHPTGNKLVVDDSVVKVSLEKAVTVSFSGLPEDAALKVTSIGATATYQPDDNGVYYIPPETYFVYEASAKGYCSTQAMGYADKSKTVQVSLSSSDYDNLTQVSASSHGTSITQGGTYALDNASGVINIDTDQHVTLVGKGIGNDAMISNVIINCNKEGAYLTLKDVYLRHSGSVSGNMVDFTGKGNTLEFAGTSIADKDTGATGYAMFHVAKDESLTVTGGTAYIYKREQGAGFGGNGNADGNEGQDPEANGTITFDHANLYMKSTKQGALIGAGGQTGKVELGPINIYDSTLYMVANSRSATIGGSAGGSGAADGSTVTVRNSQVTINCDFSGAAIGGGGYDSGNDADGGTLVYKSGSIRTYLDYNAVVSDGKNLWAWAGVTEAGVNNNAAITADVVNETGEALYLAAVPVDKVEADSDGNYDIELDGESTLYHGPLHQCKYINEALQKNSQTSVDSTVFNWVPDDDKTLYVYVPAGVHEISVNGTTFLTASSSGDKAASVGKPVDASGVKLEAKSVTYNGKAQSITATNVPTGVKVSYSGNGQKNAGTYTVKATLSCEDGYVFTDGTSSKDVTAKLTIKKATQKPKVAKTAKKVKRGKYSSKVKVTGAKGSVKYYKKSGSKYLSITKAGKVKVSKKAKKGKTYKIKVYVKAKSTANYKAATSKTVTIKVKVKK